MSLHSIEIWFSEGIFDGQVWILSNLEISDIIYHYEHLPMAYISESVIYVKDGKERILLNDFLESFFKNEMIVQNVLN